LPAAHAPETQRILDAPVGPLLWHLAAPNVLAIAAWTGITFADAWYVGQLGTAALAGLALVFPFLTLMYMTAGGAIGGAITSAVARALGGGDRDRAEAIAWHAVLVAVSLAAVFVVVFGLYARPIFQLLGGQGTALEGAVAYARITFGGAVSVSFAFCFSAIIRGTGDTATPARAITTASLSQIGLSGALTLGWFGLPAMGLAGTGAALVIAQGGSALYMAQYLLRGRARVRLRPHPFAWRPVGEIMRVGALGLINSVCMAMTVAVITGLVGRYGTAALAGYGLGARLEVMLVPIAFGVGGALTAAVGLNIGAGQHARARQLAWTGAGATLVVTGVLGIVMALMPHLWLDLFTSDPEAYAFGLSYLAIAAPFYGLFGAGQTLYFASQGTGRMAWPVSVTIFRFLCVAGFGLLAVSLAWPVDTLFAAAAAGLTIMGLGQALCLRGPGWRGAGPR